jgi:transmembrane sensor
MDREEQLKGWLSAADRRNSLRLFIMRTAAALLIITAIGIAFYKYSRWIVYTTGIKEVRTLRLADGSQVVLRPGTTLMLPGTFISTGIREVKLEKGEAYFTITSDHNRPFLVYSGPIYTKGVGTSFNIKNSSGGKEIEIAVAHGKVEVHKQQYRLAVLTKGNLIRYNSPGDFFKRDSMDNDDIAFLWVGTFGCK